jgi:hypothetical protein
VIEKGRATKHYWAFISYSSKDQQWGKWLHKRIESYSIPKEYRGHELVDGAVLGKYVRPIFRDRDELASSSNLSTDILNALRMSRFLVVLCSRNSSKSIWVNKEIENFYALGRGNYILALIVDGEPNATITGQPEKECFPPALRYPAEPLAGDLRKEGDGKERGFLKVVAGIAQLDFDNLYRRHERIQARKRAAIGITASLLVALFAVLAGLAWKKERDIRLQAAQSDFLIACEKVEQDRADLALSYLARALANNPQHVAAQARFLSLVTDREWILPRAVMRHEDTVFLSEFSPDGRWVVTASADDTAHVWDAATGKSIGQTMTHLDNVYSAMFSPDSCQVVTASADHTARVWEAATGNPIGEPMSHAQAVRSAAFSPDGRWIVTASWDNTARIWDDTTGKAVSEPMRHEDKVEYATFSPDGRWIVTASRDHTARLWPVRPLPLELGTREVELIENTASLLSGYRMNADTGLFDLLSLERRLRSRSSLLQQANNAVFGGLVRQILTSSQPTQQFEQRTEAKLK